MHGVECSAPRESARQRLESQYSSPALPAWAAPLSLAARHDARACGVPGDGVHSSALMPLERLQARVPSSASQMRSVLSSRARGDARASGISRRRSSPTSSCPSSVCRLVPVAASQMRSVLSAEPDTMRVPAGFQATDCSTVMLMPLERLQACARGHIPDTKCAVARARHDARARGWFQATEVT